MNQPDFVVKCYNKQDLAQMYFPDITVRASVNKLRRWMRRCQPLMDEILSTDFHPKTKAFSVREVRLITYYLGKPDSGDEPLPDDGKGDQPGGGSGDDGDEAPDPTV